MNFIKEFENKGLEVIEGNECYIIDSYKSGNGAVVTLDLKNQLVEMVDSKGNFKGVDLETEADIVPSVLNLLSDFYKEPNHA